MDAEPERAIVKRKRFPHAGWREWAIRLFSLLLGANLRATDGAKYQAAANQRSSE
jgi:hypothetical protein